MRWLMDDDNVRCRRRFALLPTIITSEDGKYNIKVWLEWYYFCQYYERGIWITYKYVDKKTWKYMNSEEYNYE